MSAADLAAEVGVSPSAITLIERGERNAGFKTRRRIALVLNAHEAELWPPKPRPNPVYDYGVAVFEGRCGHRWIGAVGGDYACPVCGAHDGDHHLILMEELPVQLKDFGNAWTRVAEAAATYPTPDQETSS
jgi:DNA-binding XRE family transcriptional regulator